MEGLGRQEGGRPGQFGQNIAEARPVNGSSSGQVCPVHRPVVARRRRAVVRSSPPRRPASVVAATTRPRRDRVVAGLHLPHQRHRRPSSPHPSASPRRRIPPRGRRRRVTFARVGMAPAPLPNTSPCPSARVFSSRSFAPDWNVVSCRVHVCAAPRRAAHAACRRVVPCRAPCRRAPWQAPCRAPVVHPSPAHSRVGSCTSEAPVLHLLPASRCRRRVVVASSRRRRIVIASSSSASSPLRHMAAAVAVAGRRLVVSWSPRRRRRLVIAARHPRGIAPRYPHLVRRGFTRYPHLSPRLYPRLAHPHPAWVRSEAASTQRGHPLGTCFWPL